MKLSLYLLLSWITFIFGCTPSESDISADDAVADEQTVASPISNETTDKSPVLFLSEPTNLSTRNDQPTKISFSLKQPSGRTLTADDIDIQITSDKQTLVSDEKIVSTIVTSETAEILVDVNVEITPETKSFGATTITIEVYDEQMQLTKVEFLLSYASPFGDGNDGDVTISSFKTTTDTLLLGRELSHHDRIEAISNQNGQAELLLRSTFTDDNEFTINDEVFWHVTASYGVCVEDIGKYGFARIISIDGAAKSVVIDREIDVAADANAIPIGPSNYCFVQLMRVPNFNNLTLSNALRPNGFAVDGGGILVFRVAGNLSFSGSAAIGMAAAAFPKQSGDQNIQGQGFSGLGVVVANARNGIGGGTFSSGGGGAGPRSTGTASVNGGEGGAPHLCGSGVTCDVPDWLLFGGAGGSGSDSDGQGGGSGGINLIFASSVSGTGTIISSGSNGKNTNPNEGGGGGAGSLALLVGNPGMTGADIITMNAIGGTSGNATTTGTQGGGGGGGEIYFAYCGHNSANASITPIVTGGNGSGGLRNGQNGNFTGEAVDFLCAK